MNSPGTFYYLDTCFYDLRVTKGVNTYNTYEGNVNSTLHVVLTEKWTVTIPISAYLDNYSLMEKKMFSIISNNLIKLTGISHANSGLKVLNTFMFMHNRPCIIYVCCMSR